MTAVDNDASLLIGSREVGGGQFGYLLLLARNDRNLYTFEVWGPKSQFDALRSALETSARSMRR